MAGDPVNAMANAEYHRGTVKLVRFQDVYVPDAGAEQRVCDWMINKIGWHLLNRSAANQGWMLHFFCWTLIADSDRGDKVRADRKDGYG